MNPKYTHFGYSVFVRLPSLWCFEIITFMLHSIFMHYIYFFPYQVFLCLIVKYNYRSLLLFIVLFFFSVLQFCFYSEKNSFSLVLVHFSVNFIHQLIQEHTTLDNDQTSNAVNPTRDG